MTIDEPQQYANIRWEKRWNEISGDVGVAALSRRGDKLLLVSTLGLLSFEIEDLPNVVKHHQAALRLLEGLSSDVRTTEVQTQRANGRSEDVYRNRRSQ